jgi:methyl-accepting chemotaxis protein
MLNRPQVLLRRPFPPGHFSSRPAPGQRRAIAANVMIYFAFALTALVFLTKSAIAAQAINRDVGDAIAPATVGIDASTSRLPQLDRTMRLTGKIADGTKSLSGHLDGVVSSTGSIDDNLTLIGADVDEIGTTVHGINSTVSRIRPEIFRLRGAVDGVHAKAGGISSSLRQVAADTSTMDRSLSGINASLASVLANTGPLNGNVGGIENTILVVRGHTRAIANSPILSTGRGLLPDLSGGLGLGDFGLDDLLGGGRE